MAPRTGRGHKGIYDAYNNSLHFQLAWHLACLGVVCSLVVGDQSAS
ncbi:MAG: hypothetical protein AAF206_25220 [Bacteroidota bacterium]